MKKSSEKKVGFFNQFATQVCNIAGSSGSFLAAVLVVITWAIIGPLVNYSNTWQLIINTGTTIITFLMVFLIQHTQNRDMIILNLKLDELIKSHEEANNLAIDLAKLSDKELETLEKKYSSLINKTGKK
ncbi:MAG: low affinity iron permease family protein [Legionella sp.]|nr:MAG: low affinity iron permease family protein [Legionella sp.]